MNLEKDYLHFLQFSFYLTTYCSLVCTQTTESTTTDNDSDLDDVSYTTEETHHHHGVGVPSGDESLKCTREEYEKSYKCPEAGWTLLYESCVYFSTPANAMTWDEARVACKQQKADSDLAIINLDFREKLRQLADVPKPLEHWIGLKYDATHKVFKWINGSESHALSLQPKATERCVWLSESALVVAECTDVKRFICQRVPNSKRDESDIKFTLRGSRSFLPMYSLLQLDCLAHIPLEFDKDFCYLWIPGNETGANAQYTKVYCSRREIKPHHIWGTLTNWYYRKTERGRCVRTSYIYGEVFLDYKDMFDGMKIKCCRDTYYDPWVGFRQEKCSKAITIKIDSAHALHPRMFIGRTSNAPVEPYVGQTLSWKCSGEGTNERVMSMGPVNKYSRVTWVVVWTLEGGQHQYGVRPPGLVIFRVDFDRMFRFFLVIYDITFDRSYHGSHLVCWFRNASSLLNKKITKGDVTASWSREIHVHYAPQQPDLALTSQEGTVLTIQCRAAVGNYKASRLMLGFYLSDTYVEAFSVDIKKKVHDKIINSNFELKDIDVSNKPPDGPMIAVLAELRLPAFFRNGSVFCFSYLAPRSHLFQPQDVNLQSYLLISHTEAESYTMDILLVLSRVCVCLVLITLGGASIVACFFPEVTQRSQKRRKP